MCACVTCCVCAAMAVATSSAIHDRRPPSPTTNTHTHTHTSVPMYKLLTPPVGFVSYVLACLSFYTHRHTRTHTDTHAHTNTHTHIPEKMKVWSPSLPPVRGRAAMTAANTAAACPDMSSLKHGNSVLFVHTQDTTNVSHLLRPLKQASLHSKAWETERCVRMLQQLVWTLIELAPG